jgi:hypothetical protein
MLVEDRTAFVERLEVPVEGSGKLDRHMARRKHEVLGARWEVRLAESAVLELERLLQEEGSSRRGRSLRRELGAMRKHLRAKQDELAVDVARLDRLEAKVRGQKARHQAHVAFRLHSTPHYMDCSVHRFGRLAATQLQRPVFVMKRDGRAWWWYLNRTWWDDGKLRQRQLADLVLRRDLQRVLENDAVARARIAILGRTEGPEKLPVPDSLHLDVWSRHRGRCVDCGSSERVNFDTIIATAQRRPETPRNFELRCQQCRDRREHNEGRARISRAASAVTYERIY